MSAGGRDRAAGLYIGFLWNCPWRIEWRRRFEYWDRSQCGPFYILQFGLPGKPKLTNASNPDGRGEEDQR
jgi:hypothetical protein